SSRGDTTVFCLCDRTNLQSLGQNADSQHYEPEWVISTDYIQNQPDELRAISPPADQIIHLFGLSMEPMNRLFSDHPSTWAAPTTPYTSDVSEEERDWMYHELLLLASGIQMAGPNLNANTFANGLRGARFPNPDTGIKAGHVGFNAGNHSMTIDAAEWYWSESNPGPYPDEQSGG